MQTIRIPSDLLLEKVLLEKEKDITDWSTHTRKSIYKNMSKSSGFHTRYRTACSIINRGFIVKLEKKLFALTKQYFY